MRNPALAVVVVASLLASAPVRGEAEAPRSARTDRADVARRAPQVPTYFEANRGQSAPQVDFVVRCGGYVAFLTPGGATFKTDAGAFRMRFVGAPSTVHARGLETAPGRSNYFIGNDASTWVTDVPHFARVACDDVLPGVDVVWRGDGRSVAYDVSLAPGVDPSGVRVRFEGADAVALDDRGDVVLKIAGGTATMSAPRAWQDLATGRRDVASAFVVGADGEVSFRVGAHDPARRLVIDPSFTVSTYLGGASHDQAGVIAVDAAGSLYVGGSSDSSNFPTTLGAFQTVHGANPNGQTPDAFVTKFAPSGSTLVYSTYLGGGGSDSAARIAVDAAGAAFVSGTALSGDFPVVNAYLTSGSGFLAQLTPSGNGLAWSTRLPSAGIVALDAASAIYVAEGNHVLKFNAVGSSPAYDRDVVAGNATAAVFDMAVGGSGTVWLVGWNTTSGQATAASLQTAYGGGAHDGWIVGLAADGSIVSKSYFGGSGDDRINAVALDVAGNVYVAGNTTSTNLPTLHAQQATLAGASDMFVAKLDSSAATLTWSTYVGGGTATEYARGLSVYGCGMAAVVGESAAGFATSAGPQTGYGGGVDDGVFVEFAPDGSLAQSSYIGGSTADYATAVAFDGQGRAFVVGVTTSIDFPTTPQPFQAALGAVNYYSAFLAGFPAINSPYTDVSPVTLPGATVGAAYAAQLGVGGGAAPLAWSAFTGAPAGLTLAPSGAMTGVPTAVGTSSFVAKVVDANGACAIRTFTTTVNPRPAVPTATLPSWTIGRPCSLPLAATGGTPPLTWSLKTGALPPGATIDSAGFVSSPALTQTGTYSFVVQLFDAWGVGAEGTVSMTVHATPRITTPTPTAGTEYRPLELKFDVADGTPPFVWSIASGTAPVDQPIDANTGTMKGSATAAGDYAFTIRATDVAGAVADHDYALHVNPAPFIQTTEPPWAARGRPYAFTVARKGGTAPFAWTVLGAAVPGIALVPATGELVGTPTKAGRVPISLRCSDAQFAFDERTLALVVADALDLSGRAAAGSSVVDFKKSPGAPVLRYVELIAGAELTIVVAARGLLPGAVTLYDASQNPVDVGDALVETRGRYALRKFRVPTTGRYFLEITPDAAFKGRAALRVHAPPRTRWSGTATFDASLAPVVVPFVAPPGAKFSARVAPAARSKARPTISSVTDAFASELLVSKERRGSRSSVTLAARTPLVGGDCALTIAPRSGLAGDVVWTVTLRLPRRFAFTLQNVPTEGPGK